MKKRLLSFAGLLAILTLTGAGCISFGGGAGGGVLGGVFKTINRGQEWQAKVTLPTATGIKNFGGTNITILKIDPEDHMAIYAGTDANGIFYTYDGGESWQQPNGLRSEYVADIAVDPKNKCIVYVAQGNKVQKTTDCSRSYHNIYIEALPQIFVSSIAVSPFNSAVLFIGGTDGGIYKSIDGGEKWAIKGNVQGRVVDLFVDPRNGNTVYIAVRNKGIWKSANGGETFENISNSLVGINGGTLVRRLVLDTATATQGGNGTALLLASKYKISRSVDGGITWQALPIISPESVDILALTVSPVKSEEVYYGTATTFYRSGDGGKTWATETLPTRRTASALLVDPQAPGVVYLGVLEAKQ